MHDIHFRFSDYAKEYGKLRHKDLYELLRKLDLFGKDVRIIKISYWGQTACILIENKLSDYAKIDRGIKQCVSLQFYITTS